MPDNEDGLRAALGEAHRRYTRHINIRQNWRGHLWQERFHSFLMDEDYLLATVRYVERNPVAAGLCQSPDQWQWSSVRAHLTGQDDELVRVKPMLDRIDNWHAYLSNGNDNAETDRIRRHTRTGRPLGTPNFIDTIERATGKTLAPQRPGPKPASAS